MPCNLWFFSFGEYLNTAGLAASPAARATLWSATRISRGKENNHLSPINYEHGCVSIYTQFLLCFSAQLSANHLRSCDTDRVSLFVHNHPYQLEPWWRCCSPHSEGSSWELELKTVLGNSQRESQPKPGGLYSIAKLACLPRPSPSNQRQGTTAHKHIVKAKRTCRWK